MNYLKEIDFKVNLPHAYKNTLSVFQKNILTLAKRIFKNITESIESDKVACDIQVAIYRHIRKILENTISEFNLMTEYTYKGKKKVI